MCGVVGISLLNFSVSHVTHPFSVTERPTLQLQGKFPFMSMKTEGCGDVDGRTNVLVNFSLLYKQSVS